MGHRNNYKSKMAACPFYKDEGRQSIRCEGVEDNTVVQLNFAYIADAKNYKTRHCKHNYHRCLICQMLEGKYDE